MAVFFYYNSAPANSAFTMSALELAIRTTVSVQFRQGKRNLGRSALALDRGLSSPSTLVWRSEPVKMSRVADAHGTIDAHLTLTQGRLKAIGVSLTMHYLEDCSELNYAIFDSDCGNIFCSAYARHLIETFSVGSHREVYFCNTQLIMDGGMFENVLFW